MRSETRLGTTSYNLEDSAERIAFGPFLINELDHLCFRFGIGTTKRPIVRHRNNFLPTQLKRFNGNAAELNHMTADFNTKYRQQLFGYCTARHARGSFARRRPLKYVSQIASVEF